MPVPKGHKFGPQSPEHIAKRMAAGAHAKKGVPQSPEHLAKLSAARKGRKLNVTPARSESVRKRWADGVYDHLFVRNARFAYGQVAMRSNWEVTAARRFDEAGISWRYEPRRFHLPSGRNYWPDFHLDEADVWVEIKGYLTDQAKSKFDEFLALGHNGVMIQGKNDADFELALMEFVDSVSISTGSDTAIQSV